MVAITFFCSHIEIFLCRVFFAEFSFVNFFVNFFSAYLATSFVDFFVECLSTFLLTFFGDFFVDFLATSLTTFFPAFLPPFSNFLG